MNLTVTKDDIRPKLQWLINSNEVMIDLYVPLKKIDIHYACYFPRIQGLNNEDSIAKWNTNLKIDPINTLKMLLTRELLPPPHDDLAVREAHEIEHKAFINKMGFKLKTILKYLDDKELMVR